MAIDCSYGLRVKTLFSTRVFLIPAYSIIAIPTILLNLVVLVAIWKTPSLRKPSQILLANLALTDLIVGIIIEPGTTYSNLAIINDWTHSYCFTWIICGPFAFFLASVSLSTLAIISIDRYLAIKLKAAYKTVVTSRRIIFAISAGLFINGSLYAVAVTLIFYNTPPSTFILLIAPYIIILLCTITLFYSMAFYHLKRVSSQVSVSDTNQTVSNTTPSFDVNKYQRSLHTMLIVLFAIFIFYLPYFVFASLESIFKEVILLSHLTRIGELFLAMNSCANPIVYLWRMEDLRQAVKETGRKFFKSTT